ncbi:hypothetical protein ACLLWF_004947, partial [Salmonella enterica]
RSICIIYTLKVIANPSSTIKNTSFEKAHKINSGFIPYPSRHLLSLNPLLAHSRRFPRGGG